MSDPRLHLSLLAPGASLPKGAIPLETIEPARAALERADAGGVRATLVLPEASVAEQRWVAAKLSSGLGGTFDLPGSHLELGPGLPVETRRTLALDHHLATRGEGSLGGGPADLEPWTSALDTYRGWVDEDPTTRTSLAIARDVADWAAAREDVEVEILAEERLESEGLNLLRAVGGASRISPPRLVVARSLPGDPRPPRMLLGKGITFDSGGINVKPYESFVSMMKNDMAGSALAFALFRALVESEADEPWVCVLPTCENPIGEEAMRPGSLVRGHRGLTVRIDHTDAEGRLALADGLSWASERHQPSQVICFATLTTAALIAYGPYATPVHFADVELEARLRAASAALGEDLHFFPSRLWHREANVDKEADLLNTARLPKHASRGAGSRNAAHFLRFFTDAPLVHLDIFASTWNWAGDAPGGGPGATGAPLRTLLRALGPLDAEA